MLTQRRKGGFAGWSFSTKGGGGQENSSAPREKLRSSAGVVLARDKGLIGVEGTPPPLPQASLVEKDADLGYSSGGGGAEDWKRFTEPELLNERVLLRKDKEALSERVFALESERDECLYNMGLLLIDKKKWSSQIEELRQALVEAQEFFKKEQASHIITVSELEKREENLKKALGVEKQCVIDLEKALREMRSEIAVIKFTSKKKFNDAHALEASLEQKQMEMESKVHAVDAMLADANRKNSEMDRKLEDIVARERKLQRELSSLNARRKALEKDVSKQREHLMEWEKELQEKHERLLDEQRLLNETEDKTNDMNATLKKKEAEIDKKMKKVYATASNQKSQEVDFNVRLRALTVKEKDAEIKSSSLEKKESGLIATEEKLNARESKEIQKLLDEHNAILDAKKQDSELEMVKKRRSFDEEVKYHMDLLDMEKKQVICKEAQILKSEEALKVGTDELKSKKKDLDIKSKALMKWEDSVKKDEEKLQEERKQLLKDTNDLEASRTQLHNEKAAIEAEEKKIIWEMKNLKVREEEREHHVKLQEELKQEKEEYHRMIELLEKEKELLRQEREMFDRDWEVLDGRRVALEAEVKQLSAEREKLDKWWLNEAEGLKNERLQARADMQRKLEDVRLKKEAFGKMIAQERAEFNEQVEREHADMHRDFELLKHELEMNIQRKQGDLEKKFQEKENGFERRRELELSHIKSSSESNNLKLSKLRMELNQLHREKEEYSDQKRKLEVDRQEIQKDIDTLLRLSKNLKDQREEFAKEKETFLSAAEQCKACHNCGVPINKFDICDLQPIRATDDLMEILLPTLADGSLDEHIKGSTVMSLGAPVAGSTNLGSHMTRWFDRCASLLKISPKKNVHSSSENQIGTSFGERLDSAALEEDTDSEPAPYSNHSFENQMAPFDGGDVVNGEVNRVDKTGYQAVASFCATDSSIDFKIHSDNLPQKTMVIVNDENKEMEGSSMHVENDSQHEPSEPDRRHQRSWRSKYEPIRRTHSVKAVVEDAKAILRENSDLMLDDQQNGDAKDSHSVPVESQGASVQADQATTSTREKRPLSELEPEGWEFHSDSGSLGGQRRQRKRRQAFSSLPPAPVPGDRRNNLRRSAVASTASAASASHATLHEKEVANPESLHPLPESNSLEHQGAERISCLDPQPSGALEGSSVNLLQKSAVLSLMEVQSEKIVPVYQCEREGVHPVGIIVKSSEFSEQTAEDGDEVDGAEHPDTTDSASDGESECDFEDDEDSEKHTASIGKKIWNFLTT